MNNNVTRWKIICVILFTITIYISLRSFNNEILVKNYEKERKNQIGLSSQYFQLNSKDMGSHINDTELETNNYRFFLSDLVKKKERLFYRYAQSSCQSCVEEDIKILSDYFTPSDSISVAIINSYLSKRQYLVDKSKVKLPLYNLVDDTLTLSAEKYQLSYFFILHPNMKISNVFIPDPDNKEYTHLYLQGIKRFLND